MKDIYLWFMDFIYEYSTHAMIIYLPLSFFI